MRRWKGEAYGECSRTPRHRAHSIELSIFPNRSWNKAELLHRFTQISREGRRPTRPSSRKRAIGVFVSSYVSLRVGVRLTYDDLRESLRWKSGGRAGHLPYLYTTRKRFAHSLKVDRPPTHSIELHRMLWNYGFKEPIREVSVVANMSTRRSCLCPDTSLFQTRPSVDRPASWARTRRISCASSWNRCAHS